MLLDALQTYALERAADTQVADVRIGLGYTAVLLDTGSAGLAYTFKGRAHQCCTMLPGVRPLAGAPARAVFEHITSDSLLGRTVGLAACNALCNRIDAHGCVSGCRPAYGDLLDVLAITKDDRVGMVGFFAPLLPALKQQAGEVLIFEENLDRGPGLHPKEQALDLLPSCSVAIITATSVLNNSFEQVAAAAGSCRIKAVLGASTPLLPEGFRRHGITHLSGVIVTDPQSILRVVSEGGGTRAFKGATKKINLVINS